jgi:hypothetical protein
MRELKELYDFCQALKVPPHIKRKVIEKKIQELTGQKAVVRVVDLDHEVCRGIFISATNKDVPLVQQAGGTSIIALARGLNRCWDRFVHVKELMHLFDSEDEQTPTEASFSSLLTEFVVTLPDNEESKAMGSEIRALYMALACLCPEQKRLEFVEQYKTGQLDHYNIAVQLRIPEQFIPHLLLPRFPEIISAFWTQE